MSTENPPDAVLAAQRQLELKDARELTIREPLALLVALACDQQAKVDVARLASLRLQRQLGALEAHKIVQADPGKLAEALLKKPQPGAASLHRNSKDHRRSRKLAERIRRLCGAIVSEYGGDTAAIWRGANDMEELKRRLSALPGIGRRKVEALSLLAKPDATAIDVTASYIRSRACTRARWKERQAPERERLVSEGRRWLAQHGEQLTHDRWRSLQDSGNSSLYPSPGVIRAHFGGFPEFSRAVNEP